MSEVAVTVLIAAFVFMVMDIVTGFAAAVKNGEVNSSKMREGLWHKGGFIGIIVLAIMVEFAVAHIPTTGLESVPEFVALCDTAANIPIVFATCAYIIMSEAVSIIENLGKLNPAIANSPVGKMLVSTSKSEDSDE